MSLYSPLSLISAPWHQFCSGCVPLSTTDTAALEPKAVHSSGWLPHPVENGALKTPSVGPCALWIGCTWLYFGFAPYKFLATLESRLLPFHILPSHTAFVVPSHFFLSSLLLFLKQSRVPIIGLPGPNCLLPHPHSQSSSKITCKKRQSTSTSTSSVSNFNHQHESKAVSSPSPAPSPAPPGPQPAPLGAVPSPPRAACASPWPSAAPSRCVSPPTSASPGMPWGMPWGMIDYDRLT